jgi:hypothetical protein
VDEPEGAPISTNLCSGIGSECLLRRHSFGKRGTAEVTAEWLFSAQEALKPSPRKADKRVPRQQPRDQGRTVIRGPLRSGFTCAPRLNIDVLRIAGTELAQSYNNRLGVFPSVEELFAFVVGGPTGVIAGVPAGGVRVGFGAESDAVRHRRFLPKKENGEGRFSVHETAADQEAEPIASVD